MWSLGWLGWGEAEFLFPFLGAGALSSLVLSGLSGFCLDLVADGALWGRRGLVKGWVLIGGGL